MISYAPVVKPDRVGREMNLTRNVSLNTPTTTLMIPTSSAYMLYTFVRSSRSPYASSCCYMSTHHTHPELMLQCGLVPNTP